MRRLDVSTGHAAQAPALPHQLPAPVSARAGCGRFWRGVFGGLRVVLSPLLWRDLLLVLAPVAGIFTCRALGFSIATGLAVLVLEGLLVMLWAWQPAVPASRIATTMHHLLENISRSLFALLMVLMIQHLLHIDWRSWVHILKQAGDAR